MKLYQSLISEIWPDIFPDLLKLLEFKAFVFLFVGLLAEIFFFCVLLLFVVDVLLCLQMFGCSAFLFLDLTFGNVAPDFNLSIFLVVCLSVFFDFVFVIRAVVFVSLCSLFFISVVFFPFLFKASYAPFIDVMKFIRVFCGITPFAIFLLHTFY